MTIKLERQSKIKKTYVTTSTETDAATVYAELAAALIAKKIHKCTYIKSIKEWTNYNGTRTVIVNYDGGRCKYTIKDWI